MSNKISGVINHKMFTNKRYNKIIKQKKEIDKYHYEQLELLDMERDNSINKIRKYNKFKELENYISIFTKDPFTGYDLTKNNTDFPEWTYPILYKIAEEQMNAKSIPANNWTSWGNGELINNAKKTVKYIEEWAKLNNVDLTK